MCPHARLNSTPILLHDKHGNNSKCPNRSIYIINSKYKWHYDNNNWNCINECWFKNLSGFLCKQQYRPHNCTQYLSSDLHSFLGHGWVQGLEGQALFRLSELKDWSLRFHCIHRTSDYWRYRCSDHHHWHHSLFSSLGRRDFWLESRTRWYR